MVAPASATASGDRDVDANQTTRRRLTAALILLLAVLVVLSLTHGVWGLLGQDVGRIILLEVRLPRTLLALLVGATLGLSGAALQGLLRNPLAEPGLIGASSGAALGAVIAMYFGLSSVLALALPLAGVLGALLALGALLLLAGRDPSVLRLILAGVAVSALAGALSALALNLAPSPYAALEIVFWLLGSLADRSMQHVYLAAPLILIGAALMFSTRRSVDALSLGEDVARSLGVYGPAQQARLVIGCALAVGASVSVSGSIGFVGLVVPHLLRPLVAHQPSRLFLVSALGGAALLLVADLAVRLTSVGPELKLGVATALIGAPFFLHLIVKSRRSLTA